MKTVYKIICCTGICAVLFTNDASPQGIYNTEGSSLVTNGSVQIVVQNAGFRNDGSFIKSNSNFIFSGNNITSGSFISGSTATQFNHLTLNKTANGLQLNSNISVTGTVTFQSGDSIYLNNHVLDLGSSGSITGEQNSSRFTGLNGGYIMVTRNLMAPVGINPGNIGATITSASILGNTVIKRYHTVQKLKSVSRAYEIMPEYNTTLAATLVLSYFHSEMNAITETALTTYSSSNGGTTWNQTPNTILNTTTNTISTVGLSSFSMFTLFKTGADLPVKLLYFKGVPVNRTTRLNWETAFETDNDYFEIERSANAVNFIPIGKVYSAGNGRTNQTYQFIDLQNMEGNNYYRLKQVDTDGSFAYSEIINIQQTVIKEQAGIAPNPAAMFTNLHLQADKPGTVQITITNADGKHCKTNYVQLTKGANIIPLTVYDLTRGIYMVQISGCINTTVRLLKM